jgi:hypothetical protein
MTNDLERKWHRLLAKQEQLQTELDARKREAAKIETRLAAVRDELGWLEFVGPANLGDETP